MVEWMNSISREGTVSIGRESFFIIIYIPHAGNAGERFTSKEEARMYELSGFFNSDTFKTRTLI